MTLSDEIAQTGQSIFVHLGPHKTGSTAIQRMLHENEGWLADHDIGLVSGDAAHSAAVALDGIVILAGFVLDFHVAKW